MQSTTSTPPLSSLLKSRSTLIELVVAAIVLALGVNLLASAIVSKFQTNEKAIVIIGIILTLFSLMAIARRTLATRRIARDIEGFLCFKRKSPELIPVPRYRYSEDIKHSLSALFAENEAPKKLWENDPRHKESSPSQEQQLHFGEKTAADNLIVEATEYFILETLSTHLTDYFNQPNLDSGRTRKLTREDLGPLVFGNQFLDTFSRPMKERAVFIDRAIRDGKNHQNIVAVYGKGVKFSQFDLVLPGKASVKRIGDGHFLIDAPKFLMNIKVDFLRYGALIPRGFYELYLGESSYIDFQSYTVSISTSIEFKRFSLLTRSGWEYHKWLDSFLDELENSISQEAFFNRIGWETAMTTARVVERSIAALEQKKAQQHASSGNTRSTPE